MKFPAMTLGAAILAAMSGYSADAFAAPCPSSPTCTAGGVTFDLTDPGDASHGTTVEIDDSALTFLATFDPANQSNATVAAAVLAFLGAEGHTGATYLGRQDGSGDLPGTSVTTSSSDGNLSGTWSFAPGSTDYLGSFIAIHAGGSTGDVLYAISSPGLSGVWDTSENVVGPGNQAALSNFDLFGQAQTPTTPVPEPGVLVILGGGLLALGALHRRKTS